MKLKKWITDHNHGSYNTIEFISSAAGNFTARLAQANLVIETEFNNKLKNLNQKINSNKAKHFLMRMN